jgi:hypothetical protein
MRPNDPNRRIGRSNALVRHIQEASIPWIWEGVVAEGAVTLLSAPEKIGKTTLLSLLLDRRRAGGLLLGRTVYPGKTILCSEESERLWALRQPPLDFGPDLIFHHPNPGCPSRGRWRRFSEDFFDLVARDEVYDLLVIDTAVAFLPLADRNKRTLRWVLSDLSMMAGNPAGVIILNQSRNVHRPLAAFADIVIEMEVPRHLGVTRRRTFTGVGRYPDTLQSASAELNPEGTDYVLLPDSALPHPPLVPTIQSLLREGPLTRREILARWPGDAPREDSLWRTLTRGVHRDLFIPSGAGTKSEPFRYGLPAPTKPTDRAAEEPPTSRSA